MVADMVPVRMMVVTGFGRRFGNRSPKSDSGSNQSDRGTRLNKTQRQFSVSKHI
jgi:hypothetical protein